MVQYWQLVGGILFFAGNCLQGQPGCYFVVVLFEILFFYVLGSFAKLILWKRLSYFRWQVLLAKAYLPLKQTVHQNRFLPRLQLPTGAILVAVIATALISILPNLILMK